MAMHLAEFTGNKTAFIGVHADAWSRLSRGNVRLCGLASASLRTFPLRTGSTQETKAALHIARYWRYVDDASAQCAFELADDIAKLCWRLTR